MACLTSGPPVAVGQSKGNRRTACEAADAGQLPVSVDADVETEHDVQLLTAYEIDQDDFLLDRRARIEVVDDVSGDSEQGQGMGVDEHLEVGKK